MTVENAPPAIMCFHGLATVAVVSSDGAWIHHAAPGCALCSVAQWRSPAYRPPGFPLASPVQVVIPGWIPPPAPPIDYATLPPHLRAEGPCEPRQTPQGTAPGLAGMKPLPCCAGQCPGLLRYIEEPSPRGMLYAWICDTCRREAVRGPAVGFIGHGTL